MLIDENAFGVLVSYFGVEEEEYGMEREAFVTRFEGFRAHVRECVRDHRLGAGVRAVDLGHALYVEVADGDHAESPLAWAKRVRARLSESAYDTVVAVTHGGRWVEEDRADSFVSTEHLGDAGFVTLSNPSEPLRRALYADAAARPHDSDVNVGWGPGLYLDTEAAEALGMAPKNAPTVLRTGSAAFYRAAR
jgi:hypothetical protein